MTARPGVVIGRKGSEIDKLKEDLSKMTGKEVYVDIVEVKTPELDAQLVAENIALQMERRVSFRRAMKKALQDRERFWRGRHSRFVVPDVWAAQSWRARNCIIGAEYRCTHCARTLIMDCRSVDDVWQARR